MFRYYLRVNKGNVELKQSDEQLRQKHNENIQRIEKLEKVKNESSAKITALENKVATLKEIIKISQKQKQK